MVPFVKPNMLTKMARTIESQTSNCTGNTSASKFNASWISNYCQCSFSSPNQRWTMIRMIMKPQKSGTLYCYLNLLHYHKAVLSSANAQIALVHTSHYNTLAVLGYPNWRSNVATYSVLTGEKHTTLHCAALKTPIVFILCCKILQNRGPSSTTRTLHCLHTTCSTLPTVYALSERKAREGQQVGASA